MEFSLFAHMERLTSGQRHEDLYEEFISLCKMADDGGMRGNTPSMTDIDCPDCGRKMNVRTASTGVFLELLANSFSCIRGQCKGIVNFNAKIAHGTFEFGMTEK